MDEDEAERLWDLAMTDLASVASTLGVTAALGDALEGEEIPGYQLPSEEALVAGLRVAAAKLADAEQRCAEAGVDLVHLGFRGGSPMARSLMRLRRVVLTLDAGAWVAAAFTYLRERKEEEESQAEASA